LENAGGEIGKGGVFHGNSFYFEGIWNGGGKALGFNSVEGDLICGGKGIFPNFFSGKLVDLKVFPKKGCVGGEFFKPPGKKKGVNNKKVNRES